jgi:hypothetical protein
MGKFLNVLGGIVLILVALGMLLMKPFDVDFLASLITLIEGAIPPMVGVLGLVLLFIGLEEMKSEPAPKAMPVEPIAPEATVEHKAPAYEIHRSKKKK